MRRRGGERGGERVRRSRERERLRMPPVPSILSRSLALPISPFKPRSSAMYPVDEEEEAGADEEDAARADQARLGDDETDGTNGREEDRAEAPAVTAHRRTRDDREEGRRAGAVAAVEQRVVEGGGGRVTEIKREKEVRRSRARAETAGQGAAAVARNSLCEPCTHSPRCGRARPCTSMRWWRRYTHTHAGRGVHAWEWACVCVGGERGKRAECGR